MWYYLLLVEALKTELKLLILGFHGFAEFLKNLKGDTHYQDSRATVRMKEYCVAESYINMKI